MASSEAARSVAASGGGRARVALLWSLAFLPLAWVWWRILSSDFGGGNRCVMTYMRPTYLPVPLPPREASPHAYGVYLYRENVDGRSRFTAAVEFEALGKPPRDGGPTATPAVFLPGNGGSYRQVRSLASETARLAHARRREAEASASASLASRARDPPDGDPDRGSDPSPERAARAVVDIDWFAVDFNEELSAFHAALLRRQTDHAREVVRRVLALYPPSTRVILVGHSMGGLVARGALVPLPPPVPPRASPSAPVPVPVPAAAVVLTLATPHAYSPAATQPSMARLHAHLNRAWSTGVVADVALVSVVGGVRDWQVSSSMADVEGLAPPDASLSVGVGDVPGARGVSADHQCIAWCNQLVRAAANALLDIAEGKEKTPAATRDVAASRLSDSRDAVSDSDSDSRDAWGWTTRFAIRWTPSLIPLGMAWACATLARDATPPKRTARRRMDDAASVSVAASLAFAATCAWNPALGVAFAALARLRATFRDGDDSDDSSGSTSRSSASTAVVCLAALALAPSLAATAQTTIESRGARRLSHWSVAWGALRGAPYGGADGGADGGAVFTTVDLAHVARLVEDVVLAVMAAAPPPGGRREAPGLSAERMTFAAAAATAAAGAAPGWGHLAQHAAAMAAIAPWVGRGVAMVRGGGKGD